MLTTTREGIDLTHFNWLIHLSIQAVDLTIDQLDNIYVDVIQHSTKFCTSFDLQYDFQFITQYS